MAHLYVHESYVNGTEDTICGDSGEPSEAYTDNVGDLFRCLQRAHGRCTGKVYVGEGTPVGWIFQKRGRYSDSPEIYLQEVWVTLHEKPPQKSITYHYKELS